MRRAPWRSAMAAVSSSEALSTTRVDTPARRRASRHPGRAWALSWVTTTAVRSDNATPSLTTAGDLSSRRRCAFQRGSFAWQVQPDVKFPQLLRGDLGGCAEQHHDSVDPGRHAAVGRGAVLKGPVHAPESLLEHALVVAGDRESLAHHVWAVIADRAGGDLIAVANHVVLVGRQRENPLRLGHVELHELVRPDRRHRERVVGEVDLLLVLVPLVLRKIGDPAEGELVLVPEAQIVADAGARLAG